VNDVLEEFARQHPDAVIELGEIFVSAEAMVELIGEAEGRGVGVLGLEGFLIDGADVYPSLDRIADFSTLHGSVEFVAQSAARARELLTGPWALRPGPANQMHAEAKGRYMIAVCLAMLAQG
jgi:hypothetical protein